MGIDASHAPVDDCAQRPTTDLPTAQHPEVPQVRAEMQLPSAAERIEAHRHARLAADKAYANGSAMKSPEATRSTSTSSSEVSSLASQHANSSPT